MDFLVHTDWVNINWPDLRKLKNVGLVSVFASFSFLGFIPILVFCLIAFPYGWPKNSFFTFVPKSKQFVVFAVVILTFLLPVIVTCVTYALIYCSVVVKGVNKVDAAIHPTPDAYGDIYIGPSNLEGLDDAELDEDKIANQRIQTKVNAERLAAIRSLR